MLTEPSGRVFRVLTALIVAAGITASMLYGMNKIAEKFRQRDPTRYFRVTDVIMPDANRPARRPPEAQLAPARNEPAYRAPSEQQLNVEQPHVDAPSLPAPDVEKEQLDH